jgi:hypothetical protein
MKSSDHEPGLMIGVVSPGWTKSGIGRSHFEERVRLHQVVQSFRQIIAITPTLRALYPLVARCNPHYKNNIPLLKK